MMSQLNDTLITRWQNRTDVFSSHLINYKIHERLCDCSIACSGQVFHAHRLILSMSSQYFYNIFESTVTPGSNTVIVLPDVKPIHLQKILEYIYIGEASIPCTEISAVSKVASQLKIRGFPLYGSNIPNQCNPGNASPDFLNSSSLTSDNDIKCNSSVEESSNSVKCRSSSPGLNISEFHQSISASTSKSTSEPTKLMDDADKESICLPNKIKISWHSSKVQMTSNSNSSQNEQADLTSERHALGTNNQIVGKKSSEFKTSIQSPSFQDLVNKSSSPTCIDPVDAIIPATCIKEEPNLSPARSPPRPIETSSGTHSTQPVPLSSNIPSHLINQQSANGSLPEIIPSNHLMSERESRVPATSNMPVPLLSTETNLTQPSSHSPPIRRPNYLANYPPTEENETPRPGLAVSHRVSPEHDTVYTHLRPPQYKLDLEKSHLNFISSEANHESGFEPKSGISGSTLHMRQPPPLLRLIDQPQKDVLASYEDNDKLVNKSAPHFKSHLLVKPTPTIRTHLPSSPPNLILYNHINSQEELFNFHRNSFKPGEAPINLSPNKRKQRHNSYPTGTTFNQSDPLLQKIQTNKRKRVRGPKCWEFLLRLLRDSNCNPCMIKWENKEEGIFRLIKPDVIAQRWGRRTGKHSNDSLTYENFARGLRYHYATGALTPVSEKSFVYQFGPRAQKALQGLEEIPVLQT